MKSFLTPLILLACLATAGPRLRAEEPADLRIYGKVSADLSPSRSVFTCESAEKADIVLDKLLADLFWDKTLPVREGSLQLEGWKASLPVYAMGDGYGSLLAARAGSQVVVLGGADELEVAALAAKEELLRQDDVAGKAANPRPIATDFYDNRAFKSYVPAMKSPMGFGLESHWPFLKSLGAATAFFGPWMLKTSPAPGVVDWSAQDYEVQEAERQKDMVVVGPSGGGETTLWAANRYPESMMKPSPTTLLGDWGGAGMAGSHYEAWSTPIAQRNFGNLGFLRQAMERYRDSPALGGWMLFAGAPGAEYNFHGRAMQTWDTSPLGQQGWRSWLRDARHLSLQDLGLRWYGNPKRFSHWEDVEVPDLNRFFGALEPSIFPLRKGWRWQNEAVALPEPPKAGAAGWVPFDMPPSQEQAFFDRTGFNYFDITFDPSLWMGRLSRDDKTWLVFGLIGTGNGTRVWLNGKPLDVPTDGPSRDGSFAIPVTGLLKRGANHLQVALDCSRYQTAKGKLAGPVFLTAQEPKRYPWLGTRANALLADFLGWQIRAVTDYHRKMFDLARKLDPDRPILLSGGADPLFGEAVEMARDYGMGIENTGREASYRPRLSGAGLAAGFYSTNEWSGTPKDFYLDRGFGWMFFDGDSSHCMFNQIEAFQQREKDDQWFTRHRRLIQLFGKSLRVQPKVALLLSADGARFRASGAFDIGQGELQAAHYDNVYVVEKGLRDGLADRYPVLFDTGTEFMDPETVAAIRKYVENGGTFIAVQTSGRHTFLEPDSFPLAQLSGFKASQPKGGRLKFAADLPLFKGWENKEFQSGGMALEPGVDKASPGDGAPEILARWTDNSAAVGYRKVGKGQVITLGASFWRDGREISEVAAQAPNDLEERFFEKLFTDCGVAREASASSPDIWTRKMVTKNGLQNWLVALNSTGGDLEGDLWMAVDGKPAEVFDVETGASVPFAYENGGVTLKNIAFAPWGLRVLGVRRDTLAGGLPVWWEEKATYWKRTPAIAKATAATLEPPSRTASESVLPLAKWKFAADRDGSLVKEGSWTAPEFDDSGWKTRESGAWNFFDPELKDYLGTGLYRIKVTVPPSWAGRRILLNLFNYDTPIVYDIGEFSVNGTPVVTYKARGWSQTLNYDVTTLVKPGENLVTLKAVAGPKLGGLSGCVWLEGLPPLAPALDLAGAWKVVRGDWLTHEPAKVPGTALGKYLTRSVEIPAAWNGRSVFVEWRSREQWVGILVVNGQPIANNSPVHPFGLISRVNVTPYLKPGQPNTLEIWPHNTVTHEGNADLQEVKGLQLDAIRIGCQ